MWRRENIHSYWWKDFRSIEYFVPLTFTTQKVIAIHDYQFSNNHMISCFCDSFIKILLFLTLPSRKTGKDEEGARFNSLTQLLSITVGSYWIMDPKCPLDVFFLSNRRRLIIENIITLYRKEHQTENTRTCSK